jgi:ATP-dependent DNA ligase
VALIPPIEPMLARPAERLPRPGALPGGAVYEQKLDGYRTVVFARAGRGYVQSRRGADLGRAFPEIARAAAVLPEDAVFDGELVILKEGRLDFQALQQRARHSGTSAARLARELPAHVIVFDLLEVAGEALLDRPFGERRDALERLVARRGLSAPWVLCPHTRDRATAEGWLEPAWGTVGIEGVVTKGLGQTYRPGERGWWKTRAYATAEGVIGGITGPLHSPQTLLLGRYDGVGDLRLIARSTPLPATVRRDLAQALAPAGPGHPWQGRRFSAGWGTRDPLVYQPVHPGLVAEFRADTAVDHGRYRHPVRFLRLRDDMTPADLPRSPG